jgi:hypothetical protein
MESVAANRELRDRPSSKPAGMSLTSVDCAGALAPDLLLDGCAAGGDARVDAIPSAQDHIAMYKRIGTGVFLVMSCIFNAFRALPVRRRSSPLLTFI